ncbi:MAG TPA: type IV toxin-antitoxin system AbiEi family antitoxin domain-containing protein [Phycisphaerae bacterium]|nr:type IV toxin-antitoxin system AbiEi family antitoxin domain-containing protein [Phycisphaerae bacterium]
MARKRSASDVVVEMVRRKSVLRPRDLKARGIHRECLRRLCAKGLLVRVARGLYVLARADLSSQHTLALAAQSIPRGVICLLSALRFHDIGTQNPQEVWLTIDHKAEVPRVSYPRLRIVRSSGKALMAGIDKHTIEGVTVKVYSPAKTVVDCFKYRSKIGLDVALEALRDCWRQRRATMDDLWRYAKICRMTNVMRPYLESLT